METIVDELKRRVENQPDISAFYRQSIEFISERLDAQAVMVWNCSTLPYHPIQQLSRDSESPIRVGISQQQHIELLQKAVNQDHPTLSSADTDGSSHLLLCPVQRGDHRDLIEIFVRANLPGSVYIKNKADLKICCAAIGDSLVHAKFSDGPIRSIQSQQPVSQPDFQIERFDQFAENLHQSIDHKHACFNIANESQSLLGCDRVVVVKFERKAKAVAVSGLPKFNRRADAVSTLEKLATVVLKTGQTFWYPDPDDQQLPQIAEKLDRYLSEGVTRSLVIVPIFENRGDTRLSPEEIQYEKKNPVIGAVIFENFSGEWKKDRMTEPIAMISRHAGSAYRNAFQHQDLFLYSVWRSLGKLKTLTSPRYLPKTLLALGAIAVLLLSLFFVPARMTISGEGKLVPKNRRNVFAQVSGRIDEIRIQHGSDVSADETLLQMSSSDLKIQLNEINNKIDLAKKQIEALDNQRMTAIESGRTAEEMNQQDLEHASLLNQLESFQNEKVLYQEELDRLTVKSPIAGQVISTNLREQLLDRPVMAGQILLEVAETDGQWIIEMDLPDRRIGHLQRARKDLGDDLKVSFILAADPGRKLTGTVYDVALSTQVMPESGQSIRVKIKLDNPGDVDIRQVGTDVSVKIDCGKCTLGYSLFRDLGEFWQSNVMFHFK